MNRVVLLLIGLVLVGVAGFALLWFDASRPAENRAATLLAALRDGEAAAVREEADDAFRRGWSVEDLAGRWARVGAGRGRFLGVGARRPSDDSEAPEVIALELEFADPVGTPAGRFVFTRDGEELRLHALAFWEVETPAAEPDPASLESRARLLIAHYGAGDAVRVHAGLGAALQAAWPPREIALDLARVQEAGGTLAGARPAAPATSGGADERVLAFGLDFARGAGEVRVVFGRTPDGWVVTAFEVQPPG